MDPTGSPELPLDPAPTPGAPTLACVELPRLALQLVLRSRPEWRTEPVVVVDRDSPNGLVLQANRHALRARILPGMRYAAGLSLTGRLRADVVPLDALRDACATFLERLRRFTPTVEPADTQPGLFWLDATGLRRLWPSLDAWATQLRDDLAACDVHPVVTLGFRRLFTLAAARVTRDLRILRTPDDERDFAHRVPLARLDLSPALRDALATLGIRRLGDLDPFSPADLRRRFGEEAEALRRRMREDPLPLRPRHHEEPLEFVRELDWAETDALRLMFLLKGHLAELLARAEAGALAVRSMTLRLALADHTVRIEELATAAPTRDDARLAELLRLRLDHVLTGAGVRAFTLTLGTVRYAEPQHGLFPEAARRDLAAANRALARLRAELGDDAVCRARLRDGHLPEATFTFEPLDTLRPALPDPDAPPCLVRRFFDPPRPLASRARALPDDALPGGPDDRVERVHGPFVFDGGWWNRELHREYHFIETRSGFLHWVWRDPRRKRWVLAGSIE